VKSRTNIDDENDQRAPLARVYYLVKREKPHFTFAVMWSLNSIKQMGPLTDNWL